MEVDKWANFKYHKSQKYFMEILNPSFYMTLMVKKQCWHIFRTNPAIEDSVGTLSFNGFRYCDL